MKWQRSVIWCSCGSHAISIDRWKSEIGVDTSIQLWESKGMRDHKKLRDRISDAWAALRGVLYLDGICLEDESEVQKLIEALQKEPTNWQDEE